MIGAPDGRIAAVPPPRRPQRNPGAPRRDGQAPPPDSLALSPEARQRAAAAGAGDPPRCSSNLATELTGEDVTLSARLGERFRLSGRFFHSSPTMLQGGGLLKLDYDLGRDVTAFAGGGHLPGFFNRTIGPNEAVSAPHSVGFAGIEAAPSREFDLGGGFRADLGLHALGVATLAYNHGTGAFDPSSSAGLSKATVTGEAGVSRRFGSMSARVGYGNHLDLGMIGSYYLTGGSGLFPQTHFVEAGVSGQAGPVLYRADAYLPIASATSDFSADPRFRAAISMPRSTWAPDLAITASARGVDRIEAARTWRIAGNLDASVMAAVADPFGGRPEVQAGVGLRLNFGGGGGRPRPATHPSPDWRSEPDRRPTRGPAAPVRQPRLRDYFSQAEINAMKGKPVAELAGILRTPEQVVAYLDEFVRYDNARLADPKGDYGSLTPDEVARLLAGVCRDQHAFLVSVMKEGQGIEGRQIGYLSPDTSHAIAVYKDPASGRWNVVEYGRIHYTQAGSAEEAFERIRPDALVYSNWSDGSPGDKRHQVDIHYSRTAREYYRFVQPSRNSR
ncbi:MAG: hypothetical protein FJZ01_05700 [Candidatus Sericytochromatia bacterium]|nr:hypothetical protein [Candidatus Tanganyikabacteria bacterium]